MWQANKPVLRQDIFAGSQEYGGDLEFQMGTGDHEVPIGLGFRSNPKP